MTNSAPSSVVRQVDRWVKPYGWTRQRRKGNHIIYVGPKGQRVVVSASASDQRALLNIRADLRRHGCPI